MEKWHKSFFLLFRFSKGFKDIVDYVDFLMVLLNGKFLIEQIYIGRLHKKLESINILN